MDPFRFASPAWFCALIPLLLVAVLDALRRRRKTAASFSSVVELEKIAPTFPTRLKKVLPALVYLGALLLVVALARPQSGVKESRVLGNGISIVMCVDRSGSMAAEDFEINGRPTTRLNAVKRVFKDFALGAEGLPGRPNDLIGLVAFGGFVDSCCPLTLDHESLVEYLESIETPVPLFDASGRPVRTEVIDQESGTAIGDALATAVERLKNATTKTKIVVLLSDGMQTTGALSPEEGIKVAQAYGIKVYSIGVGSSAPAPFPRYLSTGQVVMTRQILDFDSAALETIATATGGKYYEAADSEALLKICKEIDSLERTKFDAGSFAEYRDLHAPFMLVGIMALALYATLVAFRFRTFP